jgi:hypothetical protein
MPKVDLTATKDFTYNTRRLVAGDPFQARNSLDARILTRVRKVAAPGGVKARDDISEVRKEYLDKFGKRPFNGWDIATLREKIAAG